MLSLEPLSDSGASAKPTVCSADAPDEPDETTDASLLAAGLVKAGDDRPSLRLVFDFMDFSAATLPKGLSSAAASASASSSARETRLAPSFFFSDGADDARVDDDGVDEEATSSSGTARLLFSAV